MGNAPVRRRTTANVISTWAVLATTFVRENQTVLTYECPLGVPIGVLTGKADGQGGFQLAHVIAFPNSPPWTLSRLLHVGLEEAWRRQYDYVTFCLPHEFPLREALDMLGTRLGFRVYETNDDASWYVLYRNVNHGT